MGLSALASKPALSVRPHASHTLRLCVHHMVVAQAVKPARRCASVRARGPVSAVIVPEPRLRATLDLHPEVPTASP